MVARNSKKSKLTGQDQLVDEAASKSQGQAEFETALVDVGITPIVSHLGQILPSKTATDMKGAEDLFNFLKNNKRPFKYQMNIKSRSEFTKSNVVRALNCLPKMAVGRYVW